MSQAAGFDISDLFAAIEGDPSPLLDRLIPLLEGLHGKARRTKKEIRFGNKGSFSVRLPGGQWYDHESQTGGGSWKLATQLGWQAQDIARVYGLDAGPVSPKAKSAIEQRAKENCARREREQRLADEQLTKAVNLSLAKAEAVAGSVQEYLIRRGIDHP